MSTLKLLSSTPLPRDGTFIYTGLAFDGYNFYLTQPQRCKIYKCDKSFNIIKSMDTCRSYSYICYDSKENCFWALWENNHIYIYKLSKSLKEIDCINTGLAEKKDLITTGISYDCHANALLVSFSNCIIQFDKSNTRQSRMKEYQPKMLYQGVMSISPYYVTSCIKNDKNYIILYKNRKIICNSNIPNGYSVQDIIFLPIKDKEKIYLQIYVLATKNCYYPYILKYLLTLSGNNTCVNSCNFNSIKKKQCNKPYPDNNSSSNNIIHSIALIETALAHILNAEGEKIQKLLTSTDDINEILAINKTVNKMITNVTHLEQVLYSKLNLISKD